MSIFDQVSFYQYIIILALLLSIVGDVKKFQNLRLFSLFMIFTASFEVPIALQEIKETDTNIISKVINAHGCIFFYYFIFREFKKSKITDLFFIVWIIISVLYTMYIGKITPDCFNTYTLGLFMIVGMILMKFNVMIVQSPFQILWSNYKFWLGSAILIFLACSFPILMNIDRLIIQDSPKMAFYNLLNLGNIILSISYLITSILLWKET